MVLNCSCAARWALACCSRSRRSSSVPPFSIAPSSPPRPFCAWAGAAVINAIENEQRSSLAVRRIGPSILVGGTGRSRVLVTLSEPKAPPPLGLALDIATATRPRDLDRRSLFEVTRPPQRNWPLVISICGDCRFCSSACCEETWNFIVTTSPLAGQ